MSTSRCRCGCTPDVHLHHRAGTDCGHCGATVCGAYVPADFTDAQALNYLALAPYALPAEHIPEHPATTPDDHDDPHDEDGEPQP